MLKAKKLAVIISVLTIGLLFLAAYFNHRSSKNAYMENLEHLSANIETTRKNVDEIIKKIPEKNFFDTEEKNKLTNEVESMCVDINNAKFSLIKEYQNLFDANTITFLITFLSALFFTLFVTFILQNVKQYYTLKGLNQELDSKIDEANEKIQMVDCKTVEVDKKISDAKCDFDKKSLNQEYLLSYYSEYNNLNQILNLVSVLGSQLASSKYVIKPEYATLVHIIRRKTQSIIKNGLNRISSLCPEHQTELISIMFDCLTYLSIETLNEFNTKGVGLFQQLACDLDEIQSMIKKIPLVR